MSVEDRLRRLEDRLGAVEDELAVTRLILTYGPRVDNGDAAGVCELWAEDGHYDVGRDPVMQGHDDLRAMVTGRAHQRFIHGGSAHFVGPPVVHLDGDTASATTYSQLVLHREDPDRHELYRTSANRWELRRDGDTWRIVSRTSYPLDGRPAARDLLGRVGLPNGPADNPDPRP